VITLRRASADDVDWIVELLTGEDTEPFLGGQSTRDAETVREEVARSQREPEHYGRLIIETDGQRAGVMGFSETSAVHRIAHLGGLAVHPGFRGRGIADEAARLLQRYLLVELGFHRLELACYGFNDRAIRHSERVGFVREGVKRRAYMRHGEWQDAVLFSLLREDLDQNDRSEV
jgi:RimJ/RimL family protein N-acetyltransferase